ncbi:DMT family transporter [Streptomyces sp. NPDC090025]|uniref:DMT family transporter n=1 Tax=Streptomyces sp. NPDC090025 TaxID=3365922 RepID=UPI0038394A2F
MNAVGGATGTVIAVLLSLVSAAGYALAAVAQSRLASASTGGPGALRRLLGRPQWWWAVGLNAGGALAHVAALHYGPLTLVQPLGALTLVAALPIGAYGARRRVTRVEWRGALCTLAGLVGLVAVTGPADPGDALDLRETLIVTAVTLLLIGLLAARSQGRARSAEGSDGRRPQGGGLGPATASGVASAVGSALTQTLTAALARDLPGGPTVWWQTALLALLVAAFAVGGLLLSQIAYRGGGLAAPLAVVNIANPAAAAVIGVALLGEGFRAGVWGWLVAAGASLVAARGVVLLTTGRAPEPTATPEPVAVGETVAVRETVAVVGRPDPVDLADLVDRVDRVDLVPSPRSTSRTATPTTPRVERTDRGDGGGAPLPVPDTGPLPEPVR